MKDQNDPTHDSDIEESVALDLMQEDIAERRDAEDDLRADQRRPEWEETRQQVERELALLEDRIGALARMNFVRELWLEAYRLGLKRGAEITGARR